MMLCKICLQIFFIIALLPALSIGQNINDSHWWAGFKSGIGFSTASPNNRYSVLENNSNILPTQKKYNNLFKGKGPLFAITVDYSINSYLSISIQPAFQNYSFSYTSEYTWIDSSGTQNILFNLHKHSLNYIELPVLAKAGYSFGMFRIILQGGFFYGKMLNGNKTIISEEKIQANNTSLTIKNYAQSYNLSEVYIHSNLGIIAGGGISADINYFRLGLECNYRYGLNNITNVKNRYRDHSILSGSYDVPDDINLRNLEFVLHCSTPLDFLMHMPGFSAKPVRRK